MLLPKTYLVRMKEQERYRWWKPIACFLLAGFLFVVFMVLAMFALGASGMLPPLRSAPPGYGFHHSRRTHG